MVADLVSFQALILTTKASSPALLWLGHPLLPWAGGRVSFPALCPWSRLIHTQAFRGSSTVLPGQGTGPTLLSVSVCEGLGQLSRSHTLGAGSCAFAIRTRATVLPRPDARPALPEHLAGEEQGQCTCSNDPKLRSPTASSGKGQST